MSDLASFYKAVDRYIREDIELMRRLGEDRRRTWLQFSRYAQRRPDWALDPNLRLPLIGSRP